VDSLLREDVVALTAGVAGGAGGAADSNFESNASFDTASFETASCATAAYGDLGLSSPWAWRFRLTLSNPD